MTITNEITPEIQAKVEDLAELFCVELEKFKTLREQREDNLNG